MRKLYKGVGASPGIVIGKAFTLQAEDFVVLKVQLKDSEVAAEVKKFNAAIELTKREIKEIELKVNRDIGSKHSNIFSAHLMILEDPAMTTEVAKQIRETRTAAPSNTQGSSLQASKILPWALMASSTFLF